MSPFTRGVAVEDVARQAGAPGQVHELALESDQPARRDAIVETRAAAAVRLHVGELAAPRAQRLHHRALMRVLDVDGELLEGLAAFPVDVAHHHARPRHRQLVALAPHVLEQDGEVQLAAPVDGEHVGVAGFFDAQRDVGEQLALQPLAQVAAGDVLAVATRERRGVDLELHRQRRLVDRDQRQRLRALDVRERRADVQVVDPGDEHDVAGRRGFERLALQTGEAENLPDRGRASARARPSRTMTS